MRTRVTGNVAWSLWLQNENFLPLTINPTIAVDPGLQLPQPSLNDRVQTINGNLQVTSRPLPLDRVLISLASRPSRCVARHGRAASEEGDPETRAIHPRCRIAQHGSSNICARSRCLRAMSTGGWHGFCRNRIMRNTAQASVRFLSLEETAGDGRNHAEQHDNSSRWGLRSTVCLSHCEAAKGTHECCRVDTSTRPGQMPRSHFKTW